MGIKARPVGYTEEPKNPIYERALRHEYPDVVALSSYMYKVFSATSWRSSATGYYRAVVPLTVIRDGYRLMDIHTGFELPDNDPNLWANIINRSQVLILEREYQDELAAACYRYKSSNGPVIYDIDDHILAFKTIGTFHSFEEQMINDFWSGDNARRLETMVKTADAIVATTEPLAKLYAEKANCPAYAIRNCIDSVAVRWNFSHEKYPDHDNIVIGYMGGATHGQDLDIFYEIFDHLLGTYPNIKIKMIGYAPKWFFDLLENWPRKRFLTDFGWSNLDNYPQRMYDIDIGLAPLANNEFNRIGKSDLKYLEYTMAGACTVASSVGQYKESIRHKYNGLLAKTQDDWIRWLSYLVEHPDEMHAIRDRAVEDVIVNRAALQTARDWYKTIMAVRKRWETRLLT